MWGLGARGPEFAGLPELTSLYRLLSFQCNLSNLALNTNKTENWLGGGSKLSAPSSVNLLLRVIDVKYGRFTLTLL